MRLTRLLLVAVPLLSLALTTAHSQTARAERPTLVPRLPAKKSPTPAPRSTPQTPSQDGPKANPSTNEPDPAVIPRPRIPQKGVAQVFQLENGLRVILKQDTTQPMVAVRLTILSGSAAEPDRRPGLAHLVEHMAFHPSRHISQNLINELLEMGSVEMNGLTTADQITYYETVPSNRLEQVLWLESERMGYLLGDLDDEGLHREKNIVQREIEQRTNKDVYAEQHRGSWLYSDDHPYGGDFMTGQRPYRAKLKDVRAFFQGTHRPDNAVLTIAGDFRPTQARALVAKYFGSLKNPSCPVLENRMPALSSDDSRRRVVLFRGIKPIVGVDWVFAPIRDPKTRLILSMIASHLDNVMETLLLDGRDRLANHLYTGLVDRWGAGNLYVTIYSPQEVNASLVEGRASKAARRALSEAHHILDRRREIELGLMQGEQFLQWQAAEATHQLVQWGRILSQKQVLTILHSITPADVARVVESHANHSQMRTFVFRPGGTAFSGEVYR